MDLAGGAMTVEGKGNWRTSAHATRIKRARLEAEAYRLNQSRTAPVFVGKVTVCPEFPLKPLVLTAAPPRRPTIEAPNCTVRSIDGELT